MRVTKETNPITEIKRMGEILDREVRKVLSEKVTLKQSGMGRLGVSVS